MSLEYLPDSGAKSRWSLSASSFERLLAALHPDRDEAALEYERIRQLTCGLFEWWGAAHPSELTDVTFDRVARRLDEGVEIRPGSLGAFVRGIARMVFYESRREVQEAPLPEDFELAAPISDSEKETALACLDGCIESLPPHDRTSVLRYYDDAGGKRIEARGRMAVELGISKTALRIRMLRLREGLERCVIQCCEAGAKRPARNRHP